MRLAVFALALSAATAAHAQERLPPVDETARDPSFAAFKTELLRIVAEKDVTALTAIVAPDIKVDFGGGEGRDDFLDAWGLKTAPGDSAIWAELQTVLTLGAVSEEGGFIAPYVFARWPDDADAFEYVAAIVPEAPLLSDPCDPESVIARTDYTLLKALEIDEAAAKIACDWPEKFAYVSDGAGHDGFIARENIRSPIDFRARFESHDGHWQMVFFVAGD